MDNASYSPSMLHPSSPYESDSSLDEPGSGHSSPAIPSDWDPTMDAPSHSETEEYLRLTLNIPRHFPVNLSALPDITDRRQPPIAHMIKLAIWGSRDKMLTLRGIYNAIERRYPSLKDLQDKPWQRSIRHNLSLKAIFVRLERPQNMPGTGHYWAINIRNGEGTKRERKRREPGSRRSSPRSRSDEEDEFSEGTEDDRPSGSSIRAHGEHRPPHVPMNQYDQYGAAGPLMFPPATIQTPQMGYPPVVQPSRIEQSSPQPHPAQIGTSISGPPNQFPVYPGAMSLPANIQHPFYGANYGPIPFEPYMEEQTRMADTATSMTDQQMSTAGPASYGQESRVRRRASDEGQDNARKTKRRTTD